MKCIRAHAYGANVIERKDLGGWLSGPTAPEGYRPGARFGLPADGPGSPAPISRRILSMLVDASIAAAGNWLLLNGSQWGTTIIFLAINVVMLTLFGATLGQLLLGLRVLPVKGRSPMVLRALIRSLMMMLLIPVVISNSDRQLGHDMAAGVSVVRSGAQQ